MLRARGNAPQAENHERRSCQLEKLLRRVRAHARSQTSGRQNSGDSTHVSAIRFMTSLAKGCFHSAWLREGFANAKVYLNRLRTANMAGLVDYADRLRFDIDSDKEKAVKDNAPRMNSGEYEMPNVKKLVALAFVAVAFASGCGKQAKSDPSHLPLTEEQLSVYQGFLDKLGPPLHVKNLANLTVPFDFNGFPEGRPCLNGIELENNSKPLKTTHAFGPEIAKGGELILVDRHEQMKLFPKREKIAGNQPEQPIEKPAEVARSLSFLIFSEIVFDTKHRFAVLKYIWVCGEHCDSGATLVMEKAEGKWTAKPRLACALFFNNSWSEMPD